MYRCSWCRYFWVWWIVKNHFREAVDQKYRRPIEKLVRDRRGANEEDPPAEATPCPFCSKKFDSYEVNSTIFLLFINHFQLTCPFCREVSPFCIATGRHVTVEDLTKCPTCESPALIEPLAELVNSDGHCPMCSASLNNEDLVIIENAATYLKQLAWHSWQFSWFTFLPIEIFYFYTQ